MLSRTLKEYEDSYKSNLSAYLKKYEDNTEASFLEIQLNIYTSYHNSLKKISDFFLTNSRENLRVNSKINSILLDLKNIDSSAFDEIVLIGKSKIVTEDDKDEGMLILGTIPSSININFEKLNNYITSAKRILEFINKKLTNPRASDIPEKITILEDKDAEGTPEKLVNPYPQVFSNPHAYEFFEKLHEKYKDTKKPLADYSFIYRMMYKDGYILEHFKVTMYRNWLNKHYEIELYTLKTIHKCSTDSKIQNYNTIKELLQLK